MEVQVPLPATDVWHIACVVCERQKQYEWRACETTVSRRVVSGSTAHALLACPAQLIEFAPPRLARSLCTSPRCTELFWVGEKHVAAEAIIHRNFS